ncbi:hypothetical protein FQN60_010721 [Etheostoma spectabile]|uniref:Uncharacterized protein n=1 Tax=Etheostoma spectabile TaxID=54343 RepID=A0A5J5DQ85_9PERO|nr:hypothetical protein FQN60_010721 [Etheostoma spectabile]
MWTRGDLLKHLLSLTGIREDTFLPPLLCGSHHSASHSPHVSVHVFTHGCSQICKHAFKYKDKNNV